MTTLTLTGARAFVVAGTHSGVGKTVVTLILLRALRQRGLAVQPFKIGPDFIDTAYHTEVAGRESINLDPWMMGWDNVERSFNRFTERADIAVIEAMGALFDGQDGSERGSAAELAKRLELPVILVIDIWGMTRSAGALLEGFRAFDPDITLAGFVMNRAGSARHAAMVLDALPPRLRDLCLGYILQRDALAIPERHLGLVTVEENETAAASRMAALEAAGSALDLKRIVPPRDARPLVPAMPAPAAADRVRIAVAHDAAFCFYYAENLEMLRAAGAELCPIHPTVDAHLPPGAAGVYLGGGYPESFAAQLSSNVSLLGELRASAAAGMPIYAECGGFMYLGRTLTGFDGVAEPMAGVFPLDTVMDREYLAIRYVTVRTLADSPLGPAGTEARGQEFHQSRLRAPAPGTTLYDVVTSSGERSRDGLLAGAAAGSYVHLHFVSNPAVPRHFVESCRAWRKRRSDS